MAPRGTVLPMLHLAAPVRSAVLGLAFLAVAVLAGCSGMLSRQPSAEEVSRALYRHDGPPEVALITLRHAPTGEGWHSALLVNGAHRVLYNPAGGAFEGVRRGDVVYGANAAVMEDFFDYYFGRDMYAVIQRLEITPAEAATLVARIEATQLQPIGLCTWATTGVLRSLPRFEHLPQGYFPVYLMRAFRRLEGVENYILRADMTDGEGRRPGLDDARPLIWAPPPAPHRRGGDRAR